MDLVQANVALGGHPLALLLAPFLVAAILTDVSSRRIPNVLIALMLLSGLLAQVTATLDVGETLLAGFGGACVGLLVLLPFYVLGGMGAGDVKLLAGAGSFLGPQGALLAGVFTLGAGLVLGLVVIAWQRFATRRWIVAGVDQSSAAIQLPYSLAISAGTLLAVL